MEPWEWALLVIGGLVLAILCADYLGVMDAIPVSYVIYVIAILSFWESENIIRALRLASSKLVATNFATTSDGRYIPAGDYAIFTMNDIDYVFHHKGTQGCIISPRDAINRLGSQTVLTINPIEVYFNELPPTVRDKVKQYKIEPPYYIGWTSERRQLAEPATSRMELELREIHTLLNTLRDVGKGKFETVGDLLDFMNRMKEETRNKSWLERVFTGDDEEKKSRDQSEPR